MLLKVENLVKSFGALQANNNISFELEAGELVGIIGPNGAGKSTLFNCIAGFYPVTSGKITFAGRDVTNLKAHEMARLGLARTFQVYAATGDLTVEENVMVGCFLRTGSRTDSRRRARQILEDLNLAHLAKSLLAEVPVAYQKLVMAATAIGTQPRMLMLDEVAAGLNPSEAELIMQNIRHIHNDLKITVMLIEHVMTVVMNVCDRLIVLDSGEKIAEGDPSSIAANPEVIKAYLGERYVHDHHLQ